MCVCVCGDCSTENAHEDARDRALMLWCVSGVPHTYTRHHTHATECDWETTATTCYTIHFRFIQRALHILGRRAVHCSACPAHAHAQDTGALHHIRTNARRGGTPWGGSEESVPNPQLHNSSAHHWKWAVRLRDLTPLTFLVSFLWLADTARS